MNLKHRLSIGLMGVSLFGLTACGTGVNIQNPEVPLPGASAGFEDAAGDPQPPVAAGGACIILPDATDATPWETAHRTALQQAFQDVGVEVTIQNADGDPARFTEIGMSMLEQGCSILVISSIDSDSAVPVMDAASAQGATVIDYDRLTPGGAAAYFVGVDHAAAGRALGEGLATCLQAEGAVSGDVAVINEPAASAGAAEAKQGYVQALTDAGYAIAFDEEVPEAEGDDSDSLIPQLAAAQFDKILAQAKGDLVGVLAANGLAAAGVAKSLGSVGEAIPLAGMGGGAEALKRVLLGQQCVAVVSSAKAQADAAAQLAATILNGDQAATDELAVGITLDPLLEAEILSVLVEPRTVTADTVKDLVAEGEFSAADVCSTEELKAACAERGLS